MPENKETPLQEDISAEQSDIPVQKSRKEREEEKAQRLAELLEEQRRKTEEEKRQRDIKRRRAKRRLITPAVMLGVGLIAAITMFYKSFETVRMLKWLLAVLVCSGICGRLIRFMFDMFAKQNEEAVSDEGEVINKRTVNNEEINGEAHG